MDHNGVPVDPLLLTWSCENCEGHAAMSYQEYNLQDMGRNPSALLGIVSLLWNDA